MISQDEFINLVKSKRGASKNRFVKIARLVNKVVPYKFQPSEYNVADYIYVTICRARDFDMVIASIYTLFKNSKLVPRKIIIVSDGSWDVSEGYEFFKGYNLNIEMVMWDVCSSFYKSTCPSLDKWAHKHILGKRMAAILYHSENNKVLFSDPDILWYNTPITNNELESCKLKLSIDNSHNYDDTFIKSCGFEKLYDTEEPINCGAVFICGGGGSCCQKMP